MRTSDGVQEVAVLDDAILEQGVHAAPVVATRLRQEAATGLAPSRAWLDGRLDRRVVQTSCRPRADLVQTFGSGIMALLEWRHRAHGLRYERAGRLCARYARPAHTPAGTKRLSNVLRSPNWAASDRTD